jgi:hypothetical protein
MAGESYLIPQMPRIVAGYGVSTPFGFMMPPGGRVAAYVCNGSILDNADKYVQDNLVSTLAAGLQRCRAGYGDTVYVMPGHSESGVGTTGLANLVDGTRIIGVGKGSAMPTFRWTAATDNWALSKKNVLISGLRLRMEGANGVTEALTWTGADNTISGCDIEAASGASNVATALINISGAGAARAEISGNVIRGVTGSSTDGIIISAACDAARIVGNEMVFGVAVSTTHGLLTLSGAATNLRVIGNYLMNNVASTCAIAVADVASTGIVADNYMGVLTNGTASAIGIIFTGGTNSLINCFQNFCSDEKQKSGLLSPVAAT